MHHIKETEAKASKRGRGVKIWLESLPSGPMALAGFTEGEPYRLDITKDSINCVLNAPDSNRKVSGNAKRQRSIIEIHNKEAEQVFPAGTRIKVIIKEGLIVLVEHHEGKAQRDREKALVDAIAKKSITSGSLFTGGGVSTEAIHETIEAAGIDSKLVYMAELESKYIEAAGENCLAVDRDTLWIEGALESHQANIFPQVNILSASLPCAGFSTAGKSKHKQTSEAHSGSALFGTMNAIVSSNPAVIIFENVTEAQNSPIYQLIEGELNRRNYRTFSQVLDNTNTGTIEQRKRFWLIAISEGLAPESFEIPAGQINTRTIASILEDQIDPDLWAANDYLKEKAERDAKAGKGFKRQLLEGSETECGTIGRFYNKKRSTEPFLVRADGMERLLTPIEHARVKSAPEHLIRDLPKTTAHEILGQSVDYLQPVKITEALLSIFLKPSIN